MDMFFLKAIKAQLIIIQSMTFSDLALSQSGPSGNFSLQFSCVSGRVQSKHIITVTSSIKDARFGEAPPTSLIIGESDSSEFDFTLLIEVNDENKVGVEGKYPTQAFITANLTSQKNNIDIKMVNEISLFTPSQKDGVMIIPLKITKLTEDVVANVTVVVDGMNITTPYISFTLSSKVNQSLITDVKFTSYPVDKFKSGIKLFEKFDVKVELFNLLGKAVDATPYKIFLDPYFNNVGQSGLPARFFVLNSNNNIKKSGSTVTFQSCFVERAATGSYDIRVVISYDDLRDNVVFKSSFIQLYVEFPIDISMLYDISEKDNFDPNMLKSPNTKNLMTRYTTNNGLKNDTIDANNIEIEKTYVITYYLYNYITGVCKNLDIVDFSAEFLEYPPMMMALGGPTKYFDLKQISTKTDDNGLFIVEVYVKGGGIGEYVVSLDFGPSISVPIPFRTENPLVKISIDVEPAIYDKSEENTDGVYYAGTQFDTKAKVRIQVSKGTPENYIIIAHPIAISDDSLISLDIFPQSFMELNGDKENYLAWVTVMEKGIFALTDRSGVAIFNDLTVWDVTGENATMKFQFAAGDRYEGMYLTTNETRANYTFKPSLKIDLKQQPSKFISAYTTIPRLPILTVTSYIENRPFYLVTMKLIELFNKPLGDNEIGDVTNKYMSGTL